MAGVLSIAVTYQDLFFSLIKVLPQIPYDDKWENGSGYFDLAAKQQTATVPCCAFDDVGRAIILIPNEEGPGTIIIFQRQLKGRRLCIHVPEVRQDPVEEGGVIVKAAVLSAAGETLHDDSAMENDLSHSAQNRQIIARHALLRNAIRYLHKPVKKRQ
jgi:hypothetical protein